MWCLGAITGLMLCYEQKKPVSISPYTAGNDSHCEHMTLCNDLHEFTGFEHDCSALVYCKQYSEK